MRSALGDLDTDPREASLKMLPMFPAKGMFNIMKARHELWMELSPEKAQHICPRQPFSGAAVESVGLHQLMRFLDAPKIDRFRDAPYRKTCAPSF
jgi:hypothetical protein